MGAHLRRVALLLVIGLAAYAATGLTLVQPDEQVVVRRFGAQLAQPAGPGLHWLLPWGLDRVDRLKPREVKQVTIGRVLRTDTPVGSEGSQFLTADRNLVDVRATVQYTIRDAGQYLFRMQRIERLIAAAAEAALSEQLAQSTVDASLTLGQRAAALAVAERLQQRLDAYHIGIHVRSVDFVSVQPPADVADAFDGVVTALRQREQMIHEAQAFANRALAEAQGDAQRLIDEGEAERDRLHRLAQGEAQRFERLVTEYARAPELTKARMYWETMAEILPRFQAKTIIDHGTDLDLSIRGESKP